MTRQSLYFAGAWLDAAVTTGLFIHWVLVGLVVDAVGADHGTRNAASLWLALSSLGIVALNSYRSFRMLGKAREAQEAPETIFGVFAEIVAHTQMWGVCFAAARTWSLPEDNVFHEDTFLTNVADSVFEMGLVQAGVGWAAAAPTTFSERVVAWCAAYLGGVLLTNLYLLTVVVGLRGWWTLPSEQSVARPSVGAPVDRWKFDALVSQSCTR